MARTILLAVLSGAVALDVRDAHECMDEMGDQGYWPGCCWAGERSCWQHKCQVPEGSWTGCDGHIPDGACVVDTHSCTLACYCASNHWMEPLRMNDGGFPETVDYFNQVSLNNCEYNRFDNIDGRLTCTNNTEPAECDIGITQPKEGTIVIEPNDGTKCGETCCGECVTWNYHCWNCATWRPMCMNLVDYTTVTTTTTPPTWTQRSLVADEGNELKSLDSVTADDCKAACEADAACHSFSFSFEKARCHLKDKCVHSDDPSDHNPNHRGYITHYKPCTSLIVV